MVCALKVAVTLWAALIVTVQVVAVPEHAPLQPLLTSPTFVGNMGGHTSTVSAGGLFTFDTQNTLTYESVIRRGAVAPGADPNHPAGCLDDYDPANVCNRVLTGVALTGSHAILWDGLDNDGHRGRHPR